MTFSNALFCPQPEDIQFTFKEKTFNTKDAGIRVNRLFFLSLHVPPYILNVVEVMWVWRKVYESHDFSYVKTLRCVRAHYPASMVNHSPQRCKPEGVACLWSMEWYMTPWSGWRQFSSGVQSSVAKFWHFFAHLKQFTLFHLLRSGLGTTRPLRPLRDSLLLTGCLLIWGNSVSVVLLLYNLSGN